MLGTAKAPGQNFSVLSPRLIFHSSFVSHETVGIQYSRYFYPSDGARGVPQTPKADVAPDQCHGRRTRRSIRTCSRSKGPCGSSLAGLNPRRVIERREPHVKKEALRVP